MQIRQLLLVVACLLMPFSRAALAQTETGLSAIRNYEPKEYGYTPQIWAIQQDKRGVLYFGLSEVGLVEYDGHSWRTIQALDGSTVYNLAMDKNGVVYVGGYENFGYLIQDASGKTSFKSLKKDSTNIKTIWWLHATNKNVYFTAYSTIYEYSISDKTVKTYQSKSDGQFIGPFIIGDNYYVRLTKKGMMVIQDGVMKPAPHTDFFNDKRFQSDGGVMDLPDNKRLIATGREGLILYDTNPSNPPKNFHLSDREFLKDKLIYYSLSVYPDYHLIGTTTDGALLTDQQGNELNRYNEGRGLQNNGIITIANDISKNIWLGMDIGISKTEHGQDFSFWNKQSGLKGSVYSIHRFNGNLYVATDGGLFVVSKKNEIIPLGKMNQGIQNWALAEVIEGNKRKLFFCNNSGIHEVINLKDYQTILKSRRSVFLLQSKKWPNRLYSNDRDDFISLRFENNQWVKEGKWNQVEHTSSFRGIVEDESGTLWMGSFGNGIIRIVPDPDNVLNPKSVTYFNSKHGLPSNTGCRPYLHDKKVIFGTEKGLFQFNPTSQRFEPYCELGSLLCNGEQNVFLLTHQKNNRIYVCPSSTKSGGIGYVELKQNQAPTWHYKPFRRLPSMASIYADWIDDDGTYWIGGSEGLFKYDERKDCKNYDLDFKCLIRKVQTNNDSIIFWGGLGGANESMPHELDFHSNALRFEFSAPFFDQEENTKYSYQLVGYEKSWSPWSKQYNKEYTNLKEGAYTFQVKAQNIYDKVSSIATYSFIISPPLYRTWCAYMLYAIIGGTAVAGYVRLKTKALNKEKIKLEQIITHRTQDLKIANDELLTSEKELIKSNKDLMLREIELKESNEALLASDEELRQNNEELQVINDKLATTLNKLQTTQHQLVEAEKMASLGQLTAGIAHEINNPLNYISGGVQALTQLQNELLSKGKDLTATELDEIKKDIDSLMASIIKGINRTTSIVSSLRNYSNANDTIDSEENLNVRDSMENALLLLTGKVQDANVQIKTKYDHTSGVKAHGAQIDQVIMNIIDNAIYAERNNKDNKIITVATEETANEILIKIKDNGEGIPADIQGYILNPFFSTKEVGKGTGLGLSISHAIVLRHHGNLTFKSTPGIGTEFCISLPKVV